MSCLDVAEGLCRRSVDLMKGWMNLGCLLSAR